MVPVLALLALVTCCSSSAEVTSTAPIEYRDGLFLTVHPPVGEPSATIVLVHGAGLDRHDYARFANQLAEAGAVVFNADWHVLGPSKQESLEEIACAVMYARVHAAEFGADDEPVILVGHSAAASYAASVAVAGDELAGACFAEASALPAGLVLLAAATRPGGHPFPYSALGGNPGLEVVLVHGESDTVASPVVTDRFAEVLRGAGYETRVELVSGDHYDIVLVDDRDDAGHAPGPTQSADSAVSVILELARCVGSIDQCD